MAGALMSQWFVYENERPGPFQIYLPRRYDYEIGEIRAGVPFVVPDDVGAHLLTVPRFRQVEDPRKPPDPPPTTENDSTLEGPADDAGSSVSRRASAAPRRKKKGDPKCLD